jgi:hypothetical protein
MFPSTNMKTDRQSVLRLRENGLAIRSTHQVVSGSVAAVASPGERQQKARTASVPGTGTWRTFPMFVGQSPGSRQAEPSPASSRSAPNKTGRTGARCVEVGPGPLSSTMTSNTIARPQCGCRPPFDQCRSLDGIAQQQLIAVCRWRGSAYNHASF